MTSNPFYDRNMGDILATHRMRQLLMRLHIYYPGIGMDGTKAFDRHYFNTRCR